LKISANIAAQSLARGDHPRNSGKTGRWFDLIPNICGAQAARVSHGRRAVPTATNHFRWHEVASQETRRFAQFLLPRSCLNGFDRFLVPARSSSKPTETATAPRPTQPTRTSPRSRCWAR
jgi:hypothetical protein